MGLDQKRVPENIVFYLHTLILPTVLYDSNVVPYAERIA